MPKRVLVPIADGSEEIEAVTIIDVLRRAGMEVTVASVDGLQVTASRGVRLTADCLIADCAGAGFDLIALPGGIPGAEHLRDSLVLKQLLKKQKERGALYAAICAAPAVVFEPHGLLENRLATCHPAFVERLGNPSSAASRVVVDGTCITSRAPGTALEFSLKLVELMLGTAARDKVAAPLLVEQQG